MKTIKKYSLLIFMTVMLFTYSINAQTWEEIGFNLPEGDTASHNTEITFSNKNIGWLFNQYGKNGNNTLYKTSDGGQSWQKVVTITKNGFITAMFSMEPDFFYMINTDYYLSVGYDARFTTDGGITWDSTKISNEGFMALHFFTEKKGIAMSGSHSWTTTDGGRTWEQKGKIVLPNDIFFYNENLGWAVGYGPIANDVGYIAKTTDGGVSWEYLDIRIPAFSITEFGIEFIDSLNGFAVGGSVIKTIDGGNNWQTIPGVGGWDVGFLDNRNGWISSAGNIFYTSDGGETWASQLDSVMQYLFIKIIVLKKDKIAYVLGVNPVSNTATLLRADLSNITDVKNDNAMLPIEPYLEQNYPNPFNPKTFIRYKLFTTAHVLLKVYDILGKEVSTIVNKIQSAGRYQVEFDGSNLSSGVYFYSITAGDNRQVKKMLLTK